MGGMRRMTGRFLAALQFFVALKLPSLVARHVDHDSGLNRAIVYFPLAGLVIGIAVALVWLGVAALLPAMPAAGIAIAAGVILTGGLHEDGLADCADPGCAGVGTCVAYEARCDDMLDDDGDGLVDCADPECWWRPCEVLR